jgi:NAD(P)-dependent dehydrogenase (short-subunit alcohol dehydrogenase family)
MHELLDFTNETIIVVGAASDIGASIGAEFATEGATVALADIDDEQGEATAEAIRDDVGADAEYYHVDVSDLESCESLVESVLKDFGSVDHMVNIAAVAHPTAIAKPFLEEGPDDWAKQVNITFMGTIHMMYAVLPELRDNGGGSVVNFTSEAHKGQDKHLTMYGAAKSAVATFTKTVAKEVGVDDIRVNAVSPSTTRTQGTADFMNKYGDAILEEHALNRLGEPEDPAYATVFLASDAASWITGEVLSVNGGYL